ncbi:MAG TPA: DUF2721 domain-containing protein [Acidobacteriota bacterium]|nr:DUF2721 domain-containing protein [Acidobacteriota bacterium]
MAQGGVSFEVLTAMITPAVLISACGTLIFSTSTRLGRVVDRVRTLANQVQNSSPEEDLNRQEIMLDQLASVARRVVLLRSAMTCFYLSTGLFVATSIAVGIITITSGKQGWIPVVLALLGSAILLIGSILLISEAQLAVKSTLKEMSYIRDAVSKMKTNSIPKAQ